MAGELKVELLGQFRVSLDDVELKELDTERVRALLTRLVLSAGRSVDRAELAFGFWPDATESRARGNLRGLLHFVGKRGPQLAPFLEVGDRSLAWRVDAGAWVDLLEFEALAGSGHPADWQKAVALYRGPLLPGTFDDWVLQERERVARLFLTVLNLLAGSYEARGEFAAAADALERWLHEEPYQESTWARLIRLYAADRDRQRALAAFERCRRALADELGALPGTELQQLHERLSQPDGDGASAMPGVPAAARVAPLLVGRDGEKRALRSWTHSATLANRPRFLLIEGEAGLGKTALAEDLATWAQAQGAVVRWGKAYEPDRDIAFAPVRYLLQDQALMEAARAQPARWRAVLARLMPELDPESASENLTQESFEQPRLQLFAALSGLLSSGGRPQVLVADDLQWWDSASLAWLHSVLLGSDGSGLVVVATLRPEETAPEPLPALLASLEARGALKRLELGPLDEAETARLVEELAAERLPAAELERAFQESEGNPLFVQEWVHGRRAGIAAEARSYESFLDPLTGLPRRVHGLVMGRLLALTTQGRQVAEAGAVLGRSFDWATLRPMVELPDSELVEALDELCRRRILREDVRRQAAEGGYDFAHGRIRDVVEARLSTARRHFLHGRAAAALEEVHGGDDRWAARLGEHLAAAGRAEEGARQFVRAAQAALRVYANEQAEAHHRQALELLAGAPPSPVRSALYAQAWEGLGDVLHLVGRHAEAADAFESAIAAAGGTEQDALPAARRLWKRGDAERDAHRHEVAERLYDEAAELVYEAKRAEGAGEEARRALLEIAFGRLNVYYRAGRQAEMERVIAELAPLVEASSDPPTHIRYHRTLAMLGHRRNRFVSGAAEVAHAEEMVVAARRTGSAHDVAVAVFSLGFVRLWAGEVEAANSDLQAALTGAETTGDLLLEVRSLTYLSICARLLRDPLRASDLAGRAGERAARAGLREYLAASYAQQAWVASTRGDHDRVRAEGERALALWQESAGDFPFRWLAAFPLLSAALASGDLRSAADLARRSLEPSQQRLAAPLETALQGGLDAWGRGDTAGALAAFGMALELEPVSAPGATRSPQGLTG